MLAFHAMLPTRDPLYSRNCMRNQHVYVNQRSASIVDFMRVGSSGVFAFSMVNCSNVFVVHALLTASMHGFRLFGLKINEPTRTCFCSSIPASLGCSISSGYIVLNAKLNALIHLIVSLACAWGIHRSMLALFA